ncbi:MarR family winged helix-turn-helix transcriptional regulator [Saccharospirillum salsuginis]|uniref:HTH marR-type domain-containing protein n=1 Tax=Saccharospirillum salsuginis TaxID=418750 RepID=A0A918KKV8_9GAMM|nr:MarR family transcriptional regulator [Saccharospirillum salsuginis]GGX67821.1 hypothetical protein GCM10007392_39380 [Saccharospirillum salsuginis]
MANLNTRSPSVQVARLFQQLNKRLDVELAGLNLKRGQHAGLLALAEHQPCSLDTLVRVLEIDKAAASRSVASLERHGWVHTAPSPDDARRKCLTLTPEGQALATRVMECMQAVDAWFEAEYGPALCRALRSVKKGG